MHWLQLIYHFRQTPRSCKHGYLTPALAEEAPDIPANVFQIQQEGVVPKQ